MFNKKKDIDLSDVTSGNVKRSSKKLVLLIIVSVVIVALIISVAIFKILININKPACVDPRSYFTNKYEVINFFKNISLEDRFYEPKLFVPEFEGNNFNEIQIGISGDQAYISDKYTINILAMDGLGKSEMDPEKLKDLKIIEVDNIKYYLKDKEVFFERDNYYFYFRQRELTDFNFDSFINNVKIVNYEFVGSELARGKVFNENKTMKYILNGEEQELTYKYKEINYKLCIEYDVYTDGVNEYMFNKDNNLVGYRINANMTSINNKDHLHIANEEANKYLNSSLYSLETEKSSTEGSYFEYRQYIDGLKTNGFVKVRIDKNGNITELLVNDIKTDKEIPSINEYLFEKQINKKLEDLYLSYEYKLKPDKIKLVYSVDQNGELIIICNINAKLVKRYPTDYKPDFNEVSLVMVINANECIG